MAGGGSGEEENYWPGYVDALTTMTMVLTFIMMILGVVIFSMSQNVSKILIKQIAEAAKIDISGGGSLEQVRDQVIAAIKAQKTPKSEETPSSEEATQYALRGESEAAPAPATPHRGKTKLPSPPQSTSISEGNLVGNTGSDQPLTDPHEPIKVSAPPSPNKVDPGKTEPDRRIESTTNTEIAQKSSGANIRGDGSILTVAFEKRVVQLDTAATEKFKDITTKSPGIMNAEKVEIKGYADVTVMGVTEARRIAYYRAMLIRRELMAIGFNPERILVRIEDGTPADGDLVKVFAK